MTTLKIKTFTDTIRECDCCGKTNLKGTFLLVDEFNNEYYYGSTCATKKGVDSKELKKELTSYESTVRFVNSFIFRKRLDVNKTSEMLAWALENKGKSLNIFL